MPLTTDLEDTTYYLGTYGNYNTFSASKLDKIESSFPSHFYVMAPGTPETPDTPDTPETPDTNDATIADVLAGEMGTSYTVTGTVVALNAQSFLLKDATGTILVYKGYDWTADVAVGDNVTVTGASTTYGNAVQFGQDCTYTVNANGSFTQPTPSVPTAEELDAYKDKNPITPVYVKITGTLAVSGNYFNLTIDGAEIIGSLTYLSADDKEAIKALDGKLIVVEGYITGNASKGKYLNLMVINCYDAANAPEEPAGPTIADVIAGEMGTEYTVTGTVVALNAQSFLLGDETGMILVYKGYNWTADVAVGDNVTVTGASTTYGGAVQFGQDCTYTVNSNGSFTQPTPTVPTAKELDAYKDKTLITPAYVKVTGTLAVSGNYFNLAIDGATITGSLTYLLDADKEALTALNGKVITVDGYITGTASKGKYLNLMVMAYAEVTGSETPDEPENPETPDTPEAVTAPEAGVEYYFALTQENLGKTLYINGEMNGFYYATTENADEAIKVVLEAVADKAGTYYLYAMIDGVKTYLNIEQSGKYNNVKYGETAVTEYIFNTEYNTLTTVLGENTLYFGTWSNYNTFSASTIDKAATSFVAHFYPVA